MRLLLVITPQDHNTLPATPTHQQPVVGVPFQFEQSVNARRLAAKGLGVVSPQAPPIRRSGETYTREAFGGLLKQVCVCVLARLARACLLACACCSCAPACLTA